MHSAGVAAIEDGSTVFKRRRATKGLDRRATSRRRALKYKSGAGPPDWSCEVRNQFNFPKCNIAGGKASASADRDPCEACCECECGPVLSAPFTGNKKCVPVGDCDGVVISVGENCATACGC